MEVLFTLERIRSATKFGRNDKISSESSNKASASSMKVSASDTPLPNIDNSSSGKHSPMLPLLIVSPASQRARNRIQPHLDAVQMDLWISLTES